MIPASATAVTLGTTSYGFRYQLLDPRLAPSLASLIEQTRHAGLDALQICENARPLAVSTAEWQHAIGVAHDHRVALTVGCMTLDLETLRQYLERAVMVPGASMMRVVLENDSSGGEARPALERFVEQAARLAVDAGLTLAFENHFHVPCRLLAEIVTPYPPEVAAFCVDSGNSLRNWESPAQVFEILGARAVCFHVKDFRVLGSNVGFEVVGAPLGEGDLDVDATWAEIHRHPSPPIFLENWVPATGDRDADIAADAEWLARSRAWVYRRLTDGTATNHSVSIP